MGGILQRLVGNRKAVPGWKELAYPSMASSALLGRQGRDTWEAWHLKSAAAHQVRIHMAAGKAFSWGFRCGGKHWRTKGPGGYMEVSSSKSMNCTRVLPQCKLPAGTPRLRPSQLLLWGSSGSNWVYSFDLVAPTRHSPVMCCSSAPCNVEPIQVSSPQPSRGAGCGTKVGYLVLGQSHPSEKRLACCIFCIS